MASMFDGIELGVLHGYTPPTAKLLTVDSMRAAAASIMLTVTCCMCGRRDAAKSADAMVPDGWVGCVIPKSHHNDMIGWACPECAKTLDP